MEEDIGSFNPFRQISWLTALVLLVASCSLPTSTPQEIAPASPTARPAAPSATLVPEIQPTATLSAGQAPPPTELAPTSPPTNPDTPTPSALAIRRLPAGARLTIAMIRMVNADRGWAIGGDQASPIHVLRTNDGGATWHDVTPPQPTPPSAVSQGEPLGYFLDEQSAWVVYPVGPTVGPNDVKVWRTEDGGENWDASQALRVTGLEESFQPAFLTFVDGQHGWLLVVVGAGMSHRYVTLYRTEDSGATWVRVLDPTTDGGIQSLGKTGLTFVDTQIGWLTRDNFGVVDSAFFDRTHDGGATWDSVDLPPPSNLPDLFYMTECVTHSARLTSPTAGSVAVECQQYDSGEATTIAYLYRTTDGGATWNSAPYPGGELVFIDNQRVFALGRQIHRSDDGGAAWTLVKTVNWDGQFSFVGAPLAWAVATNEEGRSLVQTRNGGATWQLLEPAIGPP